ncbi:TPA: PAS domain S-box protein [Candidatus Poribacteria bacterium]|nr:PAS domain S-box protein [Candidatus Poribacteria bacterium]
MNSENEKISRKLIKDLERYKTIIDISTDAIFVQTKDGKIIDYNQSACIMFGYNKDEFFHISLSDILSNIEPFLSNENFIEAIGKRKNNETFPVEVSIKKANIDDEEIIIAYIRDITLRKNSEKALIESQNRYMEFANSLPQIVYESDLDGNITFANKQAFNVFGYTQDDFDRGMSIFDVVIPEDIKKLKESIEMLLKGEEPSYEFTMKKKDGSTFPVIAYSTLVFRDDKPVGLRGIVIDITDRKQMEEQLKQQWNILRQIADNLPDQIFMKDVDSKFVFANKEVIKALGIPSEDAIIGKSDFDLLPLEEAKRLFEEEQEIMKTGVGFANYEYSFYDTSGTKRWFSSTKVPLRDINGKVIGLVGSNRDVTKARATEDQLHDYIEILRVVFNSINDAIFIHDRYGNIIYVNDTMLKMYQVDRDEARKLSIAGDYSTTDNPLDDLPILWDKVLSGQNQLFEWKAKRPKSGEVFDVEVFLTKIKSQEQEFILATVRDISERKRAENDRQNFQKLEALGLLAGGIAHDFNNLLSVILGNVSLAMANLKDESVRDYLIKTEKAINQSMSLTKQLLTFAKGGTPVKKLMSITDLLKEATEFALSGSNINVEYEINDPWLVEIDDSQIRQVIQNIIINAKQAMPVGGTVFIKTDNIVKDEQKYLKISIKDTGVGIPKNYIDKIFDPYFTTKQTGSGLGLAICRSIIKKHGGNIYVESKIGVETIFHIELPASGMIAEKEPDIKVKEIITKPYKILIMDDEEMIRDVLTSMLQVEGHTVVASKDGAEAIEIYKRELNSANPFDLVILDLTIHGGIGGKETVRDILAINPNAKVIVSSGYSDDPIMADPKKYGFISAIAKPYKIDELNAVISCL